MSFKDEVRAALIDIKIELAKNTQVLHEHHVRSSNLESRFKPVEKHVLLVNSVFKIMSSIIGVAATVAAIYHYLIR